MLRRRDFLSALAGAIPRGASIMAASATVATEALAADDPARWRSLVGRASPWEPLSGSTRLQRIVEDLYLRERLSGDVATIDYAIFDLGPRTTLRPSRRATTPSADASSPDGVPCLALRETRFGRPQVRLALYDGDRDDPEMAAAGASARGVWRSGPIVGADLAILRAPADARDPLAPDLPAPWGVVLDRQGARPRLWTVAAARVFAPLDGRPARPESLAQASPEDVARLRGRLAAIGKPDDQDRVVSLPAQPGRSGAIIGLKRGAGAYLTDAGLYFSPDPVLIDAAGEVYAITEKSGATFPVRRF